MNTPTYLLVTLTAVVVTLVGHSSVWAQEPEADNNYWEEVLDPDGPAFQQLQARAKQAWSLGAWGAFEKTTQQMARLKPNDPATHYFQAVFASWEGKHDRAAALLQKLAQDKTFGSIPAEAVYLDLALTHTRLGALDQALDAYTHALQAGREQALADGMPLASNRAMVLSNMAELHMAKGQLDEAVAFYQRALAVASNYTHALFGLAIAFERRGDRAQVPGLLLQVALNESRQARFFSSGTFFVLPGDEHFFRGLLAEQQGQFAEARLHLEQFTQIARTAQNPWLAQGEQVLKRLAQRGPLQIGSGPLPVHEISAAAADPKGRFVALGDTLGRVLLVRLNPLEVMEAPLLSGPKVVGLAFDDTGRLVVARNDGYVRFIERNGRLGPLMGPIALPSGGALMGISPGGGVVLVSTARNQQWGVAETSNVGVELGHFELPTNVPAQFALGPWDKDRRQLTAVFWTEHRELSLVRWPQTQASVRMSPPGGRLYQAMGLTPTGSHTVLAGDAHIMVIRTADFNVQQMLQLEATQQAHRQTPKAVVVDTAGGGGWGPALIVLYPGRFRALRLEGVVPDPS